MSKRLFNIFIFLASLAIIILPAIVNAADFSLSSSKTIYTEGESFSVDVKIDLNKDSVYTAKIKLSYPVNLLEVKSFNFLDKWLPLPQAEYDLINNTNGILIKTAGYPGGVSSGKTFGTIKFYTKSSGFAIIKVSNESLLLNAENQNIFSDSETQLILNLLKKETPKEETLPKEKILPKETPTSEGMSQISTEEIKTVPVGPNQLSLKAEEPTLKETSTSLAPSLLEGEIPTGLLASLSMVWEKITHSMFKTVFVITLLAVLVLIILKRGQRHREL